MDIWNDDEISALEGLLGHIRQSKLLAILSLEPSFEEVVEAVRWAVGETADATGWPEKPRIGNILEILITEDGRKPVVH